MTGNAAYLALSITLGMNPESVSETAKMCRMPSENGHSVIDAWNLAAVLGGTVSPIRFYGQSVKQIVRRHPTGRFVLFGRNKVVAIVDGKKHQCAENEDNTHIRVGFEVLKVPG